MYVCLCRGVTDSQIRQAVAEGANTLKEVNMRLGTASQCGKCGMTTRDIVNQEMAAMNADAQNFQFYKAS